MTNKDQTPEPQRPVIKGKAIYNDKHKPPKEPKAPVPKKQSNERQEEDDGIDPILWDVVQRGLARFAREAEYRERRIFYQNNPQIKPEVPRVLIEEAMAKLPAPPKHKPVQASQLPPSPSTAFPDAATQFKSPKSQGQQNPAQGFPGGTVPKSAADPFSGTRQSNAYEVPDPHFEVQEPKDKLHPLGLSDETSKLAYNPQGYKPKASYDQQGHDVPPRGNPFQPMILKGDNNAPLYQQSIMRKGTVGHRALVFNLINLGEIPTDEQLHHFFAFYREALATAKTEVERQQITLNFQAWKNKIAENMIGPHSLKHKDGYIFIGDQAVGTREAKHAAQIDLDYFERYGIHKPPLFPTNAKEASKYDVTALINQKIAQINKAVEDTAKLYGRIDLLKGFDANKGGVGVFPLFLRDFKNNGPFDTQSIYGF